MIEYKRESAEGKEIFTVEFEKNRHKVEEIIGYTFRDGRLLCQAFTRPSYCNEIKMRGGSPPQSYQVLEFFGDGILSAAIITLMIRRCSERCFYGLRTSLNEGDFSNIKSRLSDKRNLSKSMRALGLSQYLLLGAGDRKLGVAEEDSVLEDLFESIIGAVYIDCDFSAETVCDVVGHMLDVGDYLQRSGETVKSPKNALQEYCADKARRLPPPVYSLTAESGPEHDRRYEYLCSIGGRPLETGIGKNKTQAESDAAEKTLRRLLAEEAEGGKTRELKNPVVSLSRYAAERHLPAPIYTDLGEREETGDYAKVFLASCRLCGRTEEGEGRSKKEARGNAAQKLLAAFKKNYKHDL